MIRKIVARIKTIISCLRILKKLCTKPCLAIHFQWMDTGNPRQIHTQSVLEGLSYSVVVYGLTYHCKRISKFDTQFMREEETCFGRKVTVINIPHCRS